MTADDSSLGKCLGEYRTSAAGYAALAALMLGSIAVAAGFFGIAGWGTDELGGRIVLSILGFICLLPALFGVYGLTRGRNNALRMYENGIAASQAGRVRRATWDEIESYADGLFLEIETKSGETIQFGMNGLRGVDEILARLRDEVVMRRTLPRLRSLLLQGQSVELTGVTLDSQSITPAESAQPIPWGELVEWGVSAGRVESTEQATKVDYAFVRSPTRRFQFLFESSSDRHTLLALCDELGAAARRS